MEARKSQDLLSVSWRTEKSGGINKSKSEGLRTWELIQSKPKEPKIRSMDMQGQEMMDAPAQTEKANLPFSCLFVLFRPFSRVIIKYLCLIFLCDFIIYFLTL